MAISETQKVDYLWKKLGYGLSKTDTNANKRATNESIASPLLLSGENVWSQSDQIPATIPGSSSGVVTVYPTSLPDETTADTSATTNRTWKTGLTDWIPPEFGSTYLVKAYIHTAGDAGNAASAGTQVFGAGSGNDDEWFFDYQSGILHFIGTNLPNGVNFTGKSLYISGARYTGIKGVAVPGVGVTFTSLGVESLNVSPGVSTFAGAIDANGGLDVLGHTELDNVNVSGISTLGTVKISSGIVTATSGVVTYYGDGTNLTLTDSVGLGTDTTGDYVASISGTANQIEVTGGTGEGSTPVISIPINPTLPGTTVTIQNDLQVNRNLNVTGNITVGGTSGTLFTETLKVADADLILGVRTDALGNDVSTDTTASHGGIAVASTEGTPLVTLVNPGAGETLPATYKKIMWFQQGAFAGLGTDAWLINYGVGIGSTQVPNNVVLAAGNVHVTNNDIKKVRDINASGIITASTFVSNVSDGTSPLTVTSTTLVSNLNADKLDGQEGTHYLDYANFSGIATDSDKLDSQQGSYYLDYTNFTNTPTIPTVNDATLTLETSGDGISGSDTFTANQSTDTTFTVTVSSASTDQASTLVYRDASGGFSAGIVTATSFVKASNSSGFLKADGTEDTSTYLTSYTESQTLDDVVGLGSTSSQTITVGTATTGVVIRPDGTLNVSGIVTATSFVKATNSSGFLKADGTEDTSTYLTAESDTLDSVTARGSTTTNDVSVGIITSTKFVKSSGQSTEFLKADGSVDTNTYLTSETQTLDDVVGLGSATSQTITVGTATTGVVIRPDGTLNVSGISTLGTVKISSGIITATSGIVTYYGDGTYLSNIAPAGAIEGLSVIDQNGSTVGTAGSISSLSFEGSSGVTVTATSGAAGIATVVIVESDTLDSVTARGSTTTNDVSVGIITSTKFVKSSGQSTEFLKADGSVDTNTYLTSYTETQTLDDVVGLGSATSQTITVGTATTGVVVRPDGTLNVSGVSTFQNNVNLGDAVNLYLGASQDLQIYHSGENNNSYITESGSGDLRIQADDLSILSSNGNQTKATFTTEGSVDLYYSGSKKFETTGIGISVSSGAGLTATIAGPSNLIIDPMPVGVGTTSGIVRIKGDLYVDGTTTQINSTSIELADFVVGIATTATSDLLADGAGIEIGPDNTFKYYYNGGTNSSLKSSENLNVASGKGYQIDQSEVLNETTLGSGVTNSSLTSVGIITTGTWQGTAIDDNYIGTINNADKVSLNALDIDGGTEITSLTDDDLLIVDDGANGTNRKITASNAKTYFSAGAGGGSSYWVQTDVGIHTLSSVGIGTTNPQSKLEINVGTAVSAFDIQGSAGQLFSVTNNLTSGSIFSVNDVSGIPSIDVDADGTIQLAPFGSTEYVGVGTTNPTQKLDVNGNVAIGGSIYDANGTSGSDGQVLSNVTGFGVSWTDQSGGSQNVFSTIAVSGQNNVVADTTTDTLTLVAGSNMTITTDDATDSITFASSGGGGGGSGTYDTGITTSVYVSINGGIGTAQAGLSTIAANNDIFIGPGIALTFPTTSGKSYVIESIHVTNIYNDDLYFTSRHDFNGGENVPTAQRVVVPYQGSLELLEEPIIANPSDELRFQAFAGVGTTATGINNGLDSFIVYSEKTDTDYIGTGATIAIPAGTELFTSTTNPSVLQSIRLCNYDLNIDVDASVSIYRGGSVGGILTTGVRMGYLVYNLTIPKNSVVEILERPKYLATNDTVVVGVAGTTLTDSLSATLSGKYIT